MPQNKQEHSDGMLGHLPASFQVLARFALKSEKESPTVIGQATEHPSAEGAHHEKIPRPPHLFQKDYE